MSATQGTKIKSVPAQRHGRLLVAALLAAGLVATALGLYAGAALVDPLGGARSIALTPFPETAFLLPRNTVPAQNVLRLADGHMVRLTGDGYQEAILDEATRLVIRVQLTRSDEWADQYIVGGKEPEQRWEMQITGNYPRTIIIDNPLANPDIPESLYQLLVANLRPNLVSIPTALTPASLRLRLSTIPSSDDVTGATPVVLPVQLQLATASDDGGQIVSGTELAALDANLKLTSNLGLGLNRFLMRLPDDSLRYLSWAADWTSWIGP